MINVDNVEMARENEEKREAFPLIRWSLNCNGHAAAVAHHSYIGVPCTLNGCASVLKTN